MFRTPFLFFFANAFAGGCTPALRGRYAYLTRAAGCAAGVQFRLSTLPEVRCELHIEVRIDTI
jgi:hypothetical protein